MRKSIQLRKYRFAIEAIAACYACLQRARPFVDRDKLSKSKPLGILRLGPLGIILTADACSQQEENLHMFARLIQICSAFLFASALAASSPVFAGDDGISRRKAPIALKEGYCRQGIKFFDEIHQSKLAADAGITLRPSVLLIFGNPPLGTQFITANANAGLDQCGFSSTKMRNASVDYLHRV